MMAARPMMACQQPMINIAEAANTIPPIAQPDRSS